MRAQGGGWLKTRPEIAKVLHPAFEDCPGHELWKRDFTGAGGLFSVRVRRTLHGSADRPLRRQPALFGLGYSWGGANSLVMPYRMQGMRRNWPHKGSWCASTSASKARAT
jgi:cystathionine beta-lyase